MTLLRPDRPHDDRRVWVQGVAVDYFPALPPEARRGTPHRVTEVGEDVLHRPCREVTSFGTPELARLVDDLFATQYVAEGVGLAANQIGVDLRVFVWDCTDEWGVRHVGHIVNPTLSERPADARRREDPEGCLSVPGATAPLARTDRAVMRGRAIDGRLLTIEGWGYFARCLQHESDHLDGVVYLDRLAAAERRAALREMEEQREQILARRQQRAEALARATESKRARHR